MTAPHLPDCREEDWLKVPYHLRSGLRAYLVDRERPGRFLCSLLENSLADAVLRADPESAAALRDLVLFLHNHAPARAHGSPEAVAAWLDRADAGEDL